MSRTRAKTDRPPRQPWRLACLALCGCWGLAAAAAPNPCAVWTLPLLRDPANGAALRLQLEHRAAPPKGKVWSYYALVLPEPATGPTAALTVAVLAGAQPPPRPLARLQLDGNARPVYAVGDWYGYNPDRRWGLYLIRLPTPAPRLAALGLAVEPYDPGALPTGMTGKFHGALPPRVLALEPVAAGLGAGALVCRARSPVQ